ncbi:inositol monophosphatase [Candidatus Parcubacteria bacterium]|jgi:myo-inositol-1(or 4)-monophosphatase|nr:MAG: inositol monophosphatase [Candidatus Parcubacteria bacterium]
MQPIKIALQAARAADQLLLKNFKKLHQSDVRAKSAHELVTATDKAANALIQKILKRHFPNIGILSEEGHNRKSKLRWIIDPLDGTTNFVLHIPFFGVSIALAEGSEILFGIITCPATNEIFIGAKNQGAYKNPKPLKLNPVRNLKQTIIGYGYSHSARSLHASLALAEKLSYRVRAVRHSGSTALDMAYLAAGRLDAVIIAGPVNLWDVAAGMIIVKEAGGEILDQKGQPWRSKASDLYAGRPKLLNNLRKYAKARI